MNQYIATRMINDLIPLVNKHKADFPLSFDFLWLCAVYYNKLITNHEFKSTLEDMVLETKGL